MTKAVPIVAIAGVLLAGCGVAPEGGEREVASLGFALTISRPLATDVTDFQVVVVRATLPDGSRVDCEQVEKTCVATLYPDQAVTLRNRQGDSGRALVFPASVAAGSEQELAVEVPVGKDYAVVVEALREDELLGGSCTYVSSIGSGTNSGIRAAIVPVTSPQTCNPRF